MQLSSEVLSAMLSSQREVMVVVKEAARRLHDSCNPSQRNRGISKRRADNWHAAELCLVTCSPVRESRLCSERKRY
jgi:hypothetical protein